MLLCSVTAIIRNFNPRSREGSDNKAGIMYICHLQFQSTLPRGERPNRRTQLFNWLDAFQSTLPRGERHFVLLFDFICYAISIHAPARGATANALVFPALRLISIHAPARGATKEIFCGVPVIPFQSTLPRGERPVFIRVLQHDNTFQSTLPRGERLQFYLKFTLCF